MTAPGSQGGAERWSAVEALFLEALEREPAERGAYLAASCPDTTARAEVEALLAAHEERGRFDELVDAIAPLLARESGPLASAPPATPAPSAPPFAPPALARYRIVEWLGGGGMGVVYRARDTRLERDVALKFLPPHLSADAAAKRRFLVEARAAAALEHPNVCTVHEIGDTDDGQLYIVMACYDGETLDRRIARGPLPAAEALRVAAEVARGLGKAHERGIVHRDVKPANVMVTRDGLVKVLDFGIAKLVDAAAAHTGGHAAAHTAAVVGTLAYMSPEQAFGDTVDGRTDLWSLGVVLYEMLAGVRPFRGPGTQAVLVAALSTDPEPVSRLRADVPPEVDAVLRRALAKQPADRFADAGEMLGALLAALAACSDAAAGPPVRPADEPSDAAVRDAAVREAVVRDSALARGGERRQATVVACALAGHDALVERLSPDEADAVLARVRDAATEAAERHGGIVNHCTGDALVMLFGVPTAHEDDALRGVRAALALRARVSEIAAPYDARLGARLRLRTGIHTGPVVAQRQRAGDQRFRVTGAPVDTAARLAALAAPDAVLASAECRRLAGPFVHTAPTAPLPLRADAPPVAAHRVLGESRVQSRLEEAERAGLTPYAGRARELGVLAERLAGAREGSGHLVIVVGEPGSGKSRLLHELRRRAVGEGVRVLLGRCDGYVGATPFLPFVQALHDALGLDASAAGARADERHDQAVAAVRALDGSQDASLEEFLPLYLALLAIPSEAHALPPHLQGEHLQAAMLEAVAALFTLVARQTPAVLLLEDWHWADEASRAALRQLGEMVPAYPLLLVVTSRPEAAGDWGTADHQTLLHLGPLDTQASAAIAGAVLGADRLAPELAARLHERTGGNPFFLEEVCQALREEGALVVRDGTALAADASGAVHVPETVQGVIRVRLDRLDGAARDVLRVAAVVGREFVRGVLEEVVEGAEGAERAELGRALERLKASGLILQTGVVPEPAYRFKHALTEEVAYDSLLEHQRATLHAAVGRAIERRYAGRLDEQADRLARHFGRAGAWPEAVRYGLQAADRAAALSQNADALATLESVEEWLRRLPDDAARRDLHADVLLRQERLCEALGLRNRQLALVESMTALLAPHGPSARLAQAYLRQGDAFTLLRRYESAERSLETALRIGRERGDAAGERNALRSIALLRSYQGRPAEARTVIEEVLALGRASGDTKAEAGDLATLANVLRALGEHERALRVLEEALERTSAADSPVRQGALLNVIGVMYRELGDLDTALAYFRRVSTDGVEQRHPVNASFTLPAIAHIYLLQGRTEEALATYRHAVEMNRRARYADGSAMACRALGEVLLGLERPGEAVPYLRDAAALFAQLEDASNEALMWRRAAGAYERLGGGAAAEARAAWARVHELARRTEDVAGEADAAEGIARADRELGADPASVIARYEEALALATRLGDRGRELALRNALGIVHWRRGAYPDAVRHYEAALRICRATDDRVHEGLILNSLGASLHRLRRWDEARTALLDGARVAAAAGEPRLEAHALALLGEVCLGSGRLDEARRHVEASLAARRGLDDRRGEGWMHERLARVLAAQGDPDAARAAAERAAAVARALGDEELRRAAEHAVPGATTTNPTHAG